MKLLFPAVVAALVFVSTAASAAHFTMRPVATSGTTIMFSWPRQPGADGYLLLRDGVPVARTFDPKRTTATFWKGSRYAVDVLHVVKRGRITRGPRAVYAPHQDVVRKHARLVFVPAPSPKFALRIVGRTRKTVTFAWAPQPGADGYQFVRDGAVVARTLKPSATTATFWKGTRYAVDVLRIAPGTDKVVIPVRRAVASRPTLGKKVAAARRPLVFRAAPRIDFRLRLVRQTRRSVTFTWKHQPKADGYRFLRNGIAVAQTFDRSRMRATFWKGRSYAVEVLRFAPGKRATAVTRALAFTTATAPGRTSGPAPDEGSSRAAGPASPTSSSTVRPPAKDAGSANDSPGPTPKPPAAAPKPANPPVTAPAPAPRPAPSPPAVGPGGAVSLSGSYSPSAFFQAVAVAPPGPLTIRGSFTATGDISINRPGLRIDGATVQGTVVFEAGATDGQFLNSKAQGFEIASSDGVVIDGNEFDGENTKEQNFIWAVSPPDPVDGFTIRNNTFRNFTSPGSTHSEALFIGGYARNGVVEGNTFSNNGNTAHIFFSWCAPNDCDGGGGRYSGDPRDPSNICVRGNTFNQTWEAYYDIMVRQEDGGGIGTDDNIWIAPGQPHMSTTTSVPGRLVQLLPGDNLKFQVAC